MIVPELLILAVLVLVARVGLALQVAGFSRAKNAGGAVLRVLVDTCAVVLAFWAVGSAILLKRPDVMFLEIGRLFGRGVAPGGAMVFYVSMILLGSGVVVGATVERSKFFVTFVGSVLLSALLIPLLGYWTWRGVFAGRGMVDVGGAGAVHVCSAVVAMVAAWFIGARGNKFNRDGSSNMIPGHSLPLAGVGMILTLVAWVPYLAGASILHNQPVEPVAMNALLAGAGGALTSMLVGSWKYGKPDWVLTFSGLLAGLMSVSAGGGALPGYAAVLCGAVAGLILPTVMNLVDLKLKIDDPVGLISVHLTGGAVGLLGAAVCYPVAWNLRGQMMLLAIVDLLVVVLLSGLVAGVVYGVLNKFVGLRSKEADEFDGLDLAEHDLNAYPDFQQTMIKSYHLREA